MNIAAITDPKLLSIAENCGILKEYCQFIEIVEQTYNKRFPKRSFKKAIEKAMSQGILVEYLDRKSREVINMLCAKYDYKTDIAVQREEAFEDGLNAGLEKGHQEKAIETAKNALAMKLSANQVSQITGLPLEAVLKLQEETV